MPIASFARHSLKTRVTLATTTLFMVSIWSLAFYSTRLLRVDMERMLGEQQFSTASIIAVDINQELDDRMKALEATAGRITPTILGNAFALQAYLEDRPAFCAMFNAGVAVIDSKGTAIASLPVSVGRVGVNYMERDYIAAALKEGRSSVSRPTVAKLLKTPVFGIAAPIRDEKGNVIGALAGLMDLAKPNFLDKVTESSYGKTGGYILVAPQHKLIVTATDKSRIMQAVPNPGANPLFDRYVKGFEGSGIVVDSRGLEVLSSAKRIPVAGWLLIARTPAEEAFAPIRAMQWNMLFATVLLTLVVGALTWWILRRQLAPMLVAVDALINESKSNQSPRPLPNTTQDEVGELIGGFNRLLERLGRREVALKESETNLSITLHSIGDGVIAVDTGGRVTRMNPTAERLSGWTLASAEGRQLSEVFRIVNAETRESAPDPVQLVLEHGQVVGPPNNVILLARGGQEYRIADSAAPIRNSTGETVGVVLVFNDITEKHAAQEMLRRADERFRSIFKIMPYSFTLQTKDGVLIDCSDVFCQVSGFSREELLGRTTLELGMWENPGQREAMRETLQRDGRVDDLEFDMRRRDGRVRTMQISARFLADEPEPILLSVAHDVTERKQAANDLRQISANLEARVRQRTADFQMVNQALSVAMESAEAASRAKSTFLANMSHEIRTPMNAIIGLTHLLRRSEQRPEQSERLSKIDTAANHLLSIINDILDISKIEARKLELEQADFHLSSILDNVRSLISDQARAKGLDITIDPDAVPVWLRGDPMRLRQALLNYTSNAIKFTDQGAIALRAALVDDHGDDILVRFSVEDTGVGIAPEKLSHLFNAFEQADASTTRNYGGTGLGLTITRHLAELMGGEAGAVSEPGKGSTFWFTARLQRGHGIMPATTIARSDDPEAELRRHHGGIRILLVEDNEVNREVALELLHGAGLVVETAEDGREAVDKAGANAYEMILMDVQMPRMDGLTATRLIRGMQGWDAKPILAMTANAFDEDRQACKNAGMDDFIAKPVNPDALYRVLLKWLPGADAKPTDEVAVAGAGEAPAPSTQATSEMARSANLEIAELKQRFSRIDGLDVETGLSMVRNSPPKYLRIMGIFTESHGKDPQKLAANLATRDLASIKKLAHTLKGSAGMIGAKRVAELAAALHSTIGTDARLEDIELACNAVATDLSALLQSICRELGKTAYN